MRNLVITALVACSSGLILVLVGALLLGNLLTADVVTATVTRNGELAVQYVDLNRDLSVLYRPPVGNIRDIYLLQHTNEMFVLTYDLEDAITPLRLLRYDAAAGKNDQVYASTNNLLARITAAPEMVGMSDILSFAVSSDEQYYAFFDFSASQVYVRRMHGNETIKTADIAPGIVDAAIVWSPDSRKLAFRSSQTALRISDIYTETDYDFDIDGGIYVSHEWTQDSREVIITTRSDNQYNAHIVSPERESQQWVTAPFDNPGMWCGSQWLAFQSEDADVPQVRMLDTASGTTYNPTSHIQLSSSNANYGWFWVSDSCDWIVIQQPHERKTPGRSQYESRLHLSDPTGTDIRMIFSDAFALPTLSDHESVMYFVYDFYGNKHLYRYWINGSKEYIGPVQDFIGDVTLLDDGERFLFVFENVAGNRLGLARIGISGKGRYLTGEGWSLKQFVYRHFTGVL